MKEIYRLYQVLNQYESFVILSHSTPDVDSIIRWVLLEKLLRAKGYNVTYIIPDKKIDDETLTTCLKYGIDGKHYQHKLPENPNFILVDHYETTFNGKVICVIDHHPTMKPIECDMYMNVSSSSTAMLIYNLDNLFLI